MRYIILFIFLAKASVFYAQDLVFEEIQIDTNLTAKFPGKVLSYNIENRDIYECDTNDIIYRIIKTHSRVIDKSKAGFDSSLLTFEKVAVNSLPYNYKHQRIDTIIGGTRGIFIRFYDPEIRPEFQTLYVFYTTKDSFTYSIYSNVKTDSEEIGNRIKWFYSNLKFTQNYYDTLPRHSFTSTQFWGRIISYFLVLFVLAFLMGSFFKRKKGGQ